VKISIYVRVSSNGGRQDTENQIRPLKEWVSRLGGKLVGEYIDEASGSRADREGLKRLLEDARLRKFDTLLVWCLDRLSREGIVRLAGYLEKLKGYGVRVLSHQESWLDTAGPVSDLLIAIFGWVAQQERSRIRERVMAGLKTARARGKKLGRPIREVNWEKAKDLKSKGLTIRQIAQHLGIPRSTLARAITKKSLSFAA
jgi:DNA invertase Pin-like site-specific DNA recombinase